MSLSSGSARSADTWKVSATDLANTWVGPPTGFIGVVNLTAEVQVDGARVFDRQPIRIEWIAASPAIAAQAPKATPLREPIPQIAMTTPLPEAVPSPTQVATTMPLVEPVPSPKQLDSDKIKTEQPGEQA